MLPETLYAHQRTQSLLEDTHYQPSKSKNIIYNLFIYLHLVFHKHTTSASVL